MEVATLVAVGATSFATASLVVPRITRLAVHRNLLDFPDDGRRGHVSAVPRLGGVAVFAGFLSAVGIAWVLERSFFHSAPGLPGHVGPLLAACGILFAIGLLDDLRGVRPTLKLLGQTLAALIVVQAGFHVTALELPPGYHVALGWASMPLTVLWLVGVSNAFNLVDGLDGLAGGVGVIALVTIILSKIVLGGVVTPVYSVALVGALMGFLRYNVSPARIFLGDSGSLVVGFLLAYLSIRGATRNTDNVLMVLVPICALGYPLLDTGIAMLRRWLRGEPLSRADGRHIHHQLRALGLGPHRSVLVVYSLAIVVAALGLCATYASPRFTLSAMLLAGAILVAVIGYGLPWLQYHEFLEVGASMASLIRTGRMTVRDKIHARDVAELLRDAESVEDLVGILEINAGRFRFVHMTLEGRPDRRGFPPVEVQLHPVLTWKLDYPVTRADSSIAFPIHLAIWCSTADADTSMSAERVAKIVAPAIGTWLASHWSDERVRAILAKRFPGVHTPAYVPAITGEFPVSNAGSGIRD